jgi:hypothetical protein
VGQYIVWNLSGNVIIRVTNLGPDNNADINAIFFGGALPQTPPSGASVSFVGRDTTTQGNWESAYGADGFDLAQDSSGDNPSFPAYATVTISGNSNWTWAGSTSDLRALQKAAAGSTDRLAACWYSGGRFSVDVHLSDGATHQIALYALDWDNGARNETINVVDDSAGTLLDSRTITGFQNGVYLVWNVKGNVTFQVVNTGSANAVLSGVFFGSGSPRASGPQIVPAYASNLTISTAGTGASEITRFAMGPDGRLNASTDGQGVVSFTYDATTGQLSDERTAADISGLAIAFQESTGEMYLTPLDGRIYRLSDDNHDGDLGRARRARGPDR